MGELTNSSVQSPLQALALGCRPRPGITPPPYLPLPFQQLSLPLPGCSILCCPLYKSISSTLFPITLYCDDLHCLKTSGKPDKTSRHTKATKATLLWAKAGMICLAICGVMKSPSRARVVAVKTCPKAQEESSHLISPHMGTTFESFTALAISPLDLIHRIGIWANLLKNSLIQHNFKTNFVLL